MSLVQNDSDDSVTEWIQLARRGCPSAAAKLWGRYFQSLTRYAGSRIPRTLRSIRDGEDCASEAFQALFEGFESGRLDGLNSRDDMWLLLTVIASRKVVNHSISEQRRGLSQRVEVDRKELEAGETVLGHSSINPAWLIELRETIEEQFLKLPDDLYRQIARLRLNGYTVIEIAGRVRLSPKTISRKLKLIRKLWKDHQDF